MTSLKNSPPSIALFRLSHLSFFFQFRLCTFRQFYHSILSLYRHII